MRVEAIKVAEGFLIPFDSGLRDIPEDRVLLDIELVQSPPAQRDYSAMDQLIGLCETGNANASAEHDHQVYRRSQQP